MAKYFKVVSALAPDSYRYPGPWEDREHPNGISGRVVGFGSPPHAVLVVGSVTLPELSPSGPWAGIGIVYKAPYTSNPFASMRAVVGISGRHRGGDLPHWTAIMWGASNVFWRWTTDVVVGQSGTFSFYANASGLPLTINTSLGPVSVAHGCIAGLWGNVLINNGACGYLGSDQGITGVAGLVGEEGWGAYDATVSISGAGVYHIAAPVVEGKTPADGSTTNDVYIPIEFDLNHTGLFPGTLVDGIDVTKTKVWVNGTLVCNGGVCIAGWNVVVGGGDEPHYALTHTIPFPLSTATVVVTVYAEDIDTLNVSDSWSFIMQSDVHIGGGVGGARRGGGRGGPGWGISGAWWGEGGVIVIAKDILLVNFSNRIVSDENLFDILNYEILSDTGGVVTAKVIRVLRTYFRATTSVFFHVKYLEWGNRYRFNIGANKIFDELGKPLAAQSVVWLMQRTKVDSMISFFQRLYNNKIGDFSSMRLLVQAIAMSDEIIGGFDQENSTAP